MSERVLSTDTAKQAISQMQTIINGGFQEQIQQLNRQGEVLSDPNNWDGPLASPVPWIMARYPSCSQ